MPGLSCIAFPLVEVEEPNVGFTNAEKHFLNKETNLFERIVRISKIIPDKEVGIIAERSYGDTAIKFSIEGIMFDYGMADKYCLYSQDENWGGTRLVKCNIKQIDDIEKLINLLLTINI